VSLFFKIFSVYVGKNTGRITSVAFEVAYGTNVRNLICHKLLLIAITLFGLVTYPLNSHTYCIKGTIL